LIDTGVFNSVSKIWLWRARAEFAGESSVIRRDPNSSHSTSSPAARTDAVANGQRDVDMGNGVLGSWNEQFVLLRIFYSIFACMFYGTP